MSTVEREVVVLGALAVEAAETLVPLDDADVVLPGALELTEAAAAELLAG